MRLCLPLVLAALVASTPAHAWLYEAEDYEQRHSIHGCEDRTAFWPLWRALSQHAADESPPLFPLPEILEAFKEVPLDRPIPDDFGQETQNYRPPQDYFSPLDLWEQTLEYGNGALAYVHKDFSEAIRRFDAIVAKTAKRAESGFPQEFGLFRAASAYTAARSAFRAGDFAEGARRIDRMLKDESLQEFWPEAWGLIARMRYDTDAAPLMAAELAQIGRVLILPSNVFCSEEHGGDGFKSDFAERAIRLTVEDVHLTNTDDHWAGREFQQSGIQYARKDPVIDALHAMPGFLMFRDSRYGAAVEPAAAHAREAWVATRNPLWALLLGRDAVEADVPALADAIASARAWPNLSDRARASLVIALDIDRSLTLASANHRAEAMAALADIRPQERAVVADDPPDLVRGAYDEVVNFYPRHLLGRKQHAAARQWAIDASTILKWSVREHLKPLFADSLDDIYNHPVLALRKVDGAVELGPWRRLLDDWSSEQLIAFSRRPDVSIGDRRAAVGAAWIRAVALRRWSDVSRWLPDLRSAFPGLGPEIDLIQGSWRSSTQRHFATLLTLRAPGLVVFPSWSRPPGGEKIWSPYGEVAGPADVRSFDPYDPSDGNWWCSPDPQAIDDHDREELLSQLSQDFDEQLKWDDRTRIYREFSANIPLMNLGTGDEVARLASAGSATQLLSEDTIDWERTRDWLDDWFGNDRYLPEMLHRAVMATRYGCRRPEDNSPWSQDAFRLLHRHYPASEWTRKTPYWFGVISSGY